MADKKLFALCVGINEYPLGTSNLAGCVKDAENWKNHLETHFQHLSPEILLLKNEEANRQAFIETFRRHLGQARDGDTVFFHYSGHGSQEKVATAYTAYFKDSEGKGETLVLSDSRQKDEQGRMIGHDLADKELGQLLMELSHEKPQLHVVVSLDCCHAGSGTRDTKVLADARLTGDRTNQPRPLETYLPEIFTGNEISIPTSKHGLLAACSEVQKAWETNTGSGLFTSSIMQVLEKQGPTISYADLYLKTRNKMREITQIQDPQLESVERFNTTQAIFMGETIAGHHKYARKIYQVDNRWMLNFGFAQGMPSDQITELELFKDEQALLKNHSLGNARTTTILTDKSEVEISQGDATGFSEEMIALFLTPPLVPLTVFVYGEAAGYEALKTAFDQYDSLYFELNRVDETEEYTFELENLTIPYYTRVRVLDQSGKQLTPKPGDYQFAVFGGQIFLLDENSRLIQGMVHGYDDQASIKTLFELLDDIAKWENLGKLRNKSPKLNPLDIDFHIYDADDHKMEDIDELTTYFTIKEEEPTGEVDKRNDDEKEWQGFQYALKVKNNTAQKLYFALIYLDENYEISTLFNEPIAHDLTTATTLLKNETWIDSVTQHVYNEKLDTFFSNQSTMIFKLIVSTDRLDDFALAQEAIDIGYLHQGRGLKTRSKNPIKSKVRNDWFTKTITIHTIRQRSKVGQNDLVLGNAAQLAIKGNAYISAQAQLSASNKGSRSTTHPHSLLTNLLPTGTGSLVDLGGPTGNLSILELNDIKGIDKLAGNPIELTLQEKVADDELLLPFTLDGEHVFSIGDTETMENGQTHIVIDEVPPTEEGSRSTNVGRSLKLAFFKMVLRRHPDKLYQLAWVEYLNTQGKTGQEKIDRHQDSDEVTKKVAQAHKVLLLLHGIVGDTEDMAIAVKDLATEKGYDLVLSFDYENLNSSIDKDISWSLKDQLERVGFKADDGKELHILAQGMGCLVARWMVERRGGNTFVDRMILVGPPNAGSILGTLEAYRRLTTVVLGVAVNVLLPLVGWASGLFKNIQKAMKQGQKLTTTLGEMHEGSAFIRDLNDSDDPGIPYDIIAGDVRQYEPIDGSNFSTYQEKLATKLGTFVNGNNAHDLIVDYDSMKRTGKNSQVTITKVACHHLNYFQEKTSLEAIHRLL